MSLLKMTMLIFAVMNFSCTDQFMKSKVKDQSSNSIQLAVNLDASGNYSATIDPSATGMQTMRAAGGVVSGAAIALPPGSLSIPITITIGEGSSLTTSAVSEQIGLSGNQTTSAGPSVSFIPSSSVTATSPFTLSIPFSTSLALEEDSNSVENLIVIYKIMTTLNGTDFYSVGILPSSELTIGKGAVQFQSTKFGTFQLAYSQTKIEQKLESETKAPPVLKSEIVAPSNLSYTSNSFSYTVNSIITELSPTLAVGMSDSYSVSPALPEGLSFNTSNGVISGTPTVAASSQTYTITASNEAGSTQFSLSIIVETPASNTTTTTQPTAATVLTVSSTAANGTFTSGTIPIIVTFSKSVTVTGTPQLTLAMGPSNINIGYSSGSLTSTLTFSYTVASGEYTSDLDYVSTAALILNSGTIIDSDGIAADLTLPAPGTANSLGANKNFIIAANASPTITSISSQTTAENTPINVNFQISDSDSTLQCNSTYLTATSSNSALATAASITWSGTSPNCSAIISPTTGAIGSTSIAITVFDALHSQTTANTSFNLNVTGTPFVLGQTSPTSNLNLVKGMNLPGGTVAAGGKFFAVDSNNHRILVWNSVPTSTHQAPNFSLGQSNLNYNYYNQGGAPSASSLASPAGIASCGTKLLVADQDNSRVLIWDNISALSQGVGANLVLGQADFVSSGSNRYSSPSGSTLSFPTNVFCDGTRVFVSDTSNNRVLIWTSLPSTNGQSAALALGQPNLTSNAPGTSSSSLSSPGGVYSANITSLDVIYVADSLNHRVLIWTTMPSTNGEAATKVLGQASFATAGSASSSSGLSYPLDVKVINSKLYVADNENNRILIWTNAIPATSYGEPANLVLGQGGFNLGGANSGGISLSTLNYPRFLSSDGTTLFVSDTSNHRILAWNAMPSSNGLTADFVLAQDSGTASLANNSGTAPTSLNKPSSVFKTSTQLFVADTENHRVLIWNLPIVSSGQAPNVVLGQANFSEVKPNRGGSVSGLTMKLPRAVYTDGSYLFVADTGNNRVLVWSSIPSSSSTVADFVLGQPDFANNAVNTGGANGDTMNQPYDVSICGSRLFIVDAGNNRVLVWDSIPSATGAMAHWTLGQSSLTAVSTGTTTASSLNYPTSVACTATKLLVADKVNHRVLQWDSMPTSHVGADWVLGQATTGASSQNGGGSVDGARMNYPSRVFTYAGKIYVSDTKNSRIMVWDSFVGSVGSSANSFLGQSASTLNAPNAGGLSSSSLYFPMGFFTDGVRSYMADTENNRVLIIPN